jgi:hypothetical protein
MGRSTLYFGLRVAASFRSPVIPGGSGASAFSQPLAIPAASPTSTAEPWMNLRRLCSPILEPAEALA